MWKFPVSPCDRLREGGTALQGYSGDVEAGAGLQMRERERERKKRRIESGEDE